MTCNEILRQYLLGSMEFNIALGELHAIFDNALSPSEQREAGFARSASSFIRRIQQYYAGIASEKDLCLSLRDAVLRFGRLPLPESLYNMVSTYGHEFDLSCDSDRHISCHLKVPDWLTPEQYVNDVYALRQDHFDEIERPSTGDAILRKHTVFNDYKSFEQKLAVHTAINLQPDHTLLISQPTGGGKSLVTQILSSVTDGLTIVVVPTVALALDQYDAARHILRNKDGIYCYRGEQDVIDRRAIIHSIKNRSAKLLFSSPEALLENLELYHVLNEAAEAKYLKNLVIDEAHVVPDWGVFFRPEFQLLSIAVSKWRKQSGNLLRLFLLSATLSDDVVETLFTLFGTDGKNVQLRCDALRQEPRFYFHSMHSRKDQREKLFEAIIRLPKPMVVYVLEPKEARDLQKSLKEKGFLNIPVFSGETKGSERDHILKGWKRDEYDIVLATSAFGIGVDKSNVRTIIHACCPENLSRFYQEVGRGGRDHFPSLSVLIPYQNQYDGDGDVRRALGLVQKRILTVEKTVARWNSMMSSPSSLVYLDHCILDTSTPSSMMSDEEAEYAGNMNAKWNINLLLFMKRTGFLDLEDVEYHPQKRYYTVTARYLKPEILSDPEQLTLALEQSRAREYAQQMKGYEAMRDLVASPTKQCWGHVFKHLFPLSSEVCNGCPADPDGKITVDSEFKLRVKPEILPILARPDRRLARNMGSYDELVIQRAATGRYTSDEFSVLSEKASACGIGAFVLPAEYHRTIQFDGIVLTYEEFCFSVEKAPYLFVHGVLLMFCEDVSTNIILYKKLSELNRFGCKKVIYGRPDSKILANGKTIREVISGYSIPIGKF